MGTEKADNNKDLWTRVQSAFKAAADGMLESRKFSYVEEAKNIIITTIRRTKSQDPTMKKLMNLIPASFLTGTEDIILGETRTRHTFADMNSNLIRYHNEFVGGVLRTWEWFDDTSASKALIPGAMLTERFVQEEAGAPTFIERIAYIKHANLAFPDCDEFLKPPAMVGLEINTPHLTESVTSTRERKFKIKKE